MLKKKKEEERRKDCGWGHLLHVPPHLTLFSFPVISPLLTVEIVTITYYEE